MTRGKMGVGEMAQNPVGAVQGSDGASGAGREAKAIPSRTLRPTATRRRPCCKTCKGDACMGHCKF